MWETTATSSVTVAAARFIYRFSGNLTQNPYLCLSDNLQSQSEIPFVLSKQFLLLFF
jgi:hypothetical protein